MKFHLILLIVNWSHFKTKLSNCFELNDGRSLQLSGIERKT
jgi:hypothetical protein